MLEQPVDAARRLKDVLDRLEEAAVERARRLVEFAEARRCRHASVAEHFGERLAQPCGMCDVCSDERRRTTRAAAPVVRPLPDDAGAAIVAAVRSLDWPLGRRGLAALLSGSVTAPPSARRSRFYGILGAATPGEVRRWIALLEQMGSLEAYESEDGYRLLRATAVPPPRIRRASQARDGPPDEAADGLFERLRAWRRERAAAENVPACVVLHDQTLRELAATRPASPCDLAAVKGFGPAKLARYGADVLAVIGAAPG